MIRNIGAIIDRSVQEKIFLQISTWFSTSGHPWYVHVRTIHALQNRFSVCCGCRRSRRSFRTRFLPPFFSSGPAVDRYRRWWDVDFFLAHACDARANDPVVHTHINIFSRQYTKPTICAFFSFFIYIFTWFRISCLDFCWI